MTRVQPEDEARGAAAAESTASFPDGLWCVALARLTYPALVVPSIGEVLGVRPPEGVSMYDALAVHLREKRTLLLLDNAEHLLPDLASELGPIVATAGPTIVVTSRERLGLTDEHVFAVPTLEAEDAVAFFQTAPRCSGSPPGPPRRSRRCANSSTGCRSRCSSRPRGCRSSRSSSSSNVCRSGSTS